MTDEASPASPERAGGNDAICFTAGVTSLPFAAGTIHASLVADRAPPAVVAGISAGSISAAVLQRCHRELDAARTEPPAIREAARFAFFRRYVESLHTEAPRSLWTSLPVPTDFFSEEPPLRDPSLAQSLQSDEESSIRRRFTLVHLGSWLSRLDLRIATAARMIGAGIHFREKPEQRCRTLGPLLYWGLIVVLGTTLSVILHPEWAHYGRNPRAVPRWRARLAGALGWILALSSLGSFLSWPKDPQMGQGFLATSAVAAALSVVLWGLSGRPRPLFGGAVLGLAVFTWMASVGLVTGPIAFALSCATGALAPPHSIVSELLCRFAFASGLCVLVGAALLFLAYCNRKVLLASIARNLCVSKSVLDDFGVHRWLHSLFVEDEASPPEVDGTDGSRLLIVATPLEKDVLAPKQEASSKSTRQHQVWAKPDTPLVDALRASIALPPLFAPRESQREAWIGLDGKGPVHLVDGSIVRDNPLPAFFQFLRHEAKAAKAQGRRSKAYEAFDEGQGSVHVVYGVPIESKDDSAANVSDEAVDIVEMATLALRLSKRRDTRLEVDQTRVLSRMLAEGLGRGTPYVSVRVGEIAPAEDLTFSSRVAPPADEVTRHVASGCKRSLEILYADEIASHPWRIGDRVECAKLLGTIAGARNLPPTGPGLPEVCGTCDRTLSVRTPERDDAIESRSLTREFERWSEESESGHRPLLTLAASGGVFRGSFQIGMIGALGRHGVELDVVMGASVGAIFGSPAAAASGLEGKQLRSMLSTLVETFTSVDEQVALTWPLRNAIREIGVRACRLDVSPHEIRRVLERGGREDAGFAVAHAPPVLVDSMSTLLLLPRAKTEQIASGLVAGKVAEAVARLLEALRSETLTSLGIKDAIMGTSLLAPKMRAVLQAAGGDLASRQPFVNDERRSWMFMTATDVGRQRSAQLGGDNYFEGAPADFIECLAASSAFPAVFSPPRESDVYPGTGGRSVRYSDGGMFDNLPVIPLVRMIAGLQRAVGAQRQDVPALEARLAARSRVRHVVLAAALDVDIASKTEADPKEWDLFSIARRIQLIGANVKLRGVGFSSNTVHELLQKREPDPEAPAEKLRRLDAFVDAKILPVFPQAESHLNGTFSFCRTLGLDETKIRRSIAHGCFQTHAALHQAYASPEEDSTITTFVESRRLPLIRLTEPVVGRCKPVDRSSGCPYFLTVTDAAPNGEAFDCPFATKVDPVSMRPSSTIEVFEVCRRDETHRERYAELRKITPAP